MAVVRTQRNGGEMNVWVHLFLQRAFPVLGQREKTAPTIGENETHIYNVLNLSNFLADSSMD